MIGDPVRNRAKARWLLLAALVVLGVMAATLALRNRGLIEGYEVAFGGGEEDELPADGVLDAIVWAEFSPDAVREKETSEPVDVGGQPGKLSRGWYANGNIEYEETWLSDRQHGRETWWDEHGQKLKEHYWQDGYLQGRSTLWYANGQMAKDAAYDRFRLHGKHTTWFRDGQECTRAEFRDGLREGEFLAWHPNGQKHCQAAFFGDRLQGLWQKLDADGRLLRRAEYEHGVVASETSVKDAPPAVIDELLRYKQTHYPDDRRRFLTCGIPNGKIRVEWLDAAAPGVDSQWEMQLYGLIRTGARDKAIR